MNELRSYMSLSDFLPRTSSLPFVFVFLSWSLFWGVFFVQWQRHQLHNYVLVIIFVDSRFGFLLNWWLPWLVWFCWFVSFFFIHIVWDMLIRRLLKIFTFHLARKIFKQNQSFWVICFLKVVPLCNGRNLLSFTIHQHR